MAYDRLTTLVVDVLPWVKMRHQNWWTLDRTWELLCGKGLDSKMKR